MPVMVMRWPLESRVISTELPSCPVLPCTLKRSWRKFSKAAESKMASETGRLQSMTNLQPFLEAVAEELEDKVYDY